MYVGKYPHFSEKISANVMMGKSETGEEKRGNVEEGRKRKDKEVATFSALAITLRYDFALSHKAFLLSRIVIAPDSYRSEHIVPVIASYHSDGIDKRYRNYSLSLLEK